MSETHEETTGVGLVPSGVHGQIGGLDLYGNKILSIKADTGQLLVEYGVVTLKSGEMIELSYSDLEKLNAFTETGQKGLISFRGGSTQIDTVMIGKIDTKKRLEDAPVELKPKTRDNSLRVRELTHYEVETNDGKGWKWTNVTPENGRGIIKALVTNDKDIRKRVRQLKPVYAMKYATESVDGKDMRVERKLDHIYQNIPLTRIDEYGAEVIMWYWAKPLNEDGKGKPKVGYKKVIEQIYNEQTGEYELARRLDACTPDEIEYLDRGGY